VAFAEERFTGGRCAYGAPLAISPALAFHAGTVEIMPIRHKIEPAVVGIVRRLVADGYEAYIVGGAVRDLLLGLEPKDYDLATSASPEEVRRVFGRRRARLIGRRFRLAHVYVGRECYEVSTFRREPTPAERRGRNDDDGVIIWSDNEFGTLEEDANRRDFTVNALYFDPVGDRGLIDLVGGAADLDEGVVRAIGDPALRVAEDPVRMLRALKLVGQYDFRLEQGLKDAIRTNLGQITLSSKARLFEELLKVVSRPYSCKTLAALAEYGLLAHFWPSLDAAWRKDDVGPFARDLLSARDGRVAAGGYSTSKSLALATLSLAAVAKAVGEAGLGDLWGHREGLECDIRDAIQGFFTPLPVSRYFTARVRDILMLTARLKEGRVRKRLLRHPEYKYARELFSLLVAVCGWPGSQLDTWPPSRQPPRVSRDGSGPDGRPRRSRRSRRRPRSRP